MENVLKFMLKNLNNKKIPVTYVKNVHRGSNG